MNHRAWVSGCLILLVSLFCVAQDRASNPDTRVACPILVQESLTAYGFSKATLVSLWYARNAATKLHDPLNDPSDETWWRMVKQSYELSTNDFICAKEPVKAFTSKGVGDKVNTLANFLATTYDGLISINHREIEFHEKRRSLAERNPELYLRQLQEHMEEEVDAMPAFPSERDQRWSDLAIPPDRALVLLADLKHVDEKGIAGLAITKAQKQALLDWANEHFPEFKDGTPRDKWTEPAKIAHTYFEYFEGRKCIDE